MGAARALPRQRKVGPVLFRTSKELRVIEVDDIDLCELGSTDGPPRRVLCFLSIFGLRNERAILVHGVEPQTLSVSLLPLGEAELRHLLAHSEESSARLLMARWLGQLSTPIARRSRLNRDEWAEVSEWLLSRMVMHRARVVRGSAVDTLPGHFVVALEKNSCDSVAEDWDESDELESFSRRAYGQVCIAAGVNSIDQPLKSFGLEEYDRLRQTALAVCDEKQSPDTFAAQKYQAPSPEVCVGDDLGAPPAPHSVTMCPMDIVSSPRENRATPPADSAEVGFTDQLASRMDRIEALLLDKLAARASMKPHPPLTR